MKPTVFNYEKYQEAIKETERLKKENEKLKKKIANLEIRWRIAHEDKM